MQVNYKTFKKFHDLGFAIHWLRPKSKVPLLGGWTKGDRLSLKQLTSTYKEGLNVGVRLGEASKIGDHYLAVLDLDIKSEDPKHRLEAEAKAFEMFPEIKIAPKVLSGRGGGSAHFYVKILHPTKGDLYKFTSPDIIKVHMPSVNPSKKELNELEAIELKAGVRLRPAWEVCLMSEGRQVAMPPSIHPDSGRAYQWVNEPDTIDDIPFIETELAPAEKYEAEVKAPEVFESEIDIETLGLKEDQLEALRSGEGVEDRSAYIFGLCMAMIRRGVSKSDILSVLSNRNLFLGNVAFDHAKTKRRERAKLWLENYCYKKAEKTVKESDYINDIKVEFGDFVEDLDTSGGKNKTPVLRPTFRNIFKILQESSGHDFIGRNMFSQEDTWLKDTPWGCKRGARRSSGSEDALRVKTWLIDNFKIEAQLNTIEEVLLRVTDNNSFHPVQDYLKSLEWDGTPRIRNAFRTYLGSNMPEPYLGDVSEKFFIALIKRVFEAGCKFDYIPVFEGAQGIGKSSFGAILVGNKWFMDGLPNLADKDAALSLQGQWLVEMSELSSLYRSQLEAAKAFITRQTDKVRPPYGRRQVELPRQSLFIGTTNDKEYLQDRTGNRRFWPVEVEGLDFEGLTRDREQLLAEALFEYQWCDHKMYLEGETMQLAEELRGLRQVTDEYDTMLDKFNEWSGDKEASEGFDLSCLNITDLFRTGCFQEYLASMANLKRAGQVLKDCGYTKVHLRKGKRWVLNPRDYQKDPRPLFKK